MNVLMSLMLVLSAHVASAKAESACAQCSSFEQLTVKMKNNAPGALDAAKAKMQDVTFAKDAGLAKLEAAAYVRFALATIKADESTKTNEALDYYSGAAKAYPKLIKAALKTLTPAEQAYLDEARRESERGFAEGNG